MDDLISMLFLLVLFCCGVSYLLMVAEDGSRWETDKENKKVRYCRCCGQKQVKRPNEGWVYVRSFRECIWEH